MESRVEKQINYADVFAKINASDLIRNGVALLLEHRPQNPIDVLVDYFHSVVSPVPQVTKAYRILRLAKNHPKLDTQYLEHAYSALAEEKGLRGREFMQLLGILSADFSPLASDVILSIFRKLDHEAVSFQSFTTAVETCLTYKEFLVKSEQLFNAIDSRNTGSAPKELCEAILTSLASAATDTFNTSKVSDRHVTLEELDPAIESMLLKEESETSALTLSGQIRLSTFVRSASSLFLKIVLYFGGGQQRH